MALGRKVVNFVRLNHIEQTLQPTAIGEIAVVQVQTNGRLVYLLEQMRNSTGIEGRRFPHDAVNNVPFC